MRYQSKVVEIEAMQFDGKNFASIYEWAKSLDALNYLALSNTPEGVRILTLEGDDVIARPGHWIICGVRRELYPCDPEVFNTKYREYSKGRMTLQEYFEKNLDRKDTPYPVIDHSIRARRHQDGQIGIYIHATGFDSDTVDFYVEGNQLLGVEGVLKP